MPKKVDHGQRREEIAEAVCRLAGREGLDGVSLRQVATEAGVSMGRVQHYFTTKDEMLRFAFRTISERVEQRMATAVAGLGESPPPRALVRALLVEMLPLSEPARAEAPVLATFLARAVVEPALAESQRADAERLREFVTAQIGAAPGNPALEATALLAIVDGLMTQLLIGHVDPATALSTLDYQLDRIFGAA
ncbi:MAG TPA: TetR family transcriptional regulator C-terminal domain-containing protein [Actinophytocola sp.]|jgi:AcrR family transcriptional regulator|nr:TetR family transcriptional regulator C-terminal domain-containing protein [Actinophytocola sp.]